MVLSPKSAKERCASVATLVETRPLPADAVPARGGLYFCSGRRCVWACGGGSGACDELRGVVLVDLSGTSCQFAATGRTYCELASRTRTHGLDGARFVRIVSDAIKGASPRERAALVFFLRGSDFGLRSAPGVGPRSPSVASHVCGFLSKRADERGRTLGDDGDSEDGEDDDDTENDTDDDEALASCGALEARLHDARSPRPLCGADEWGRVCVALLGAFEAEPDDEFANHDALAPLAVIANFDFCVHVDAGVDINHLGLGGPRQTSELSSSVMSTSIRLIFERIDCSRRVLEAEPKSLRRNFQIRSQ